MIVTAALDKALRAAGVPIDGVRVGRANDRATWRVDFTNAATDAHRAAAQAVITAFDPVAEQAKPKPKPLEDRVVDLEGEVVRLKSVKA